MDAPDTPNHGRESEDFWNQWNRDWRFRSDIDPFMRRQLEIVADVARAENLREARILGFGCGTGWMENSLVGCGEVWGTDLSPEAIAEGQRRYPGLHLRCCDFLLEALPGPFDLVLSSDSLVPMADHAECIRRVAELVRPGGVFLLMTQNPFVWARRSRFRPVPSGIPHPTPDTWPTRGRVRELLQPWFTIERAFTFEPGGDRGVLWWIENDAVTRIAHGLLGEYRWRRLLEGAGLGRELVFIARRREGAAAAG